MKRILLLCYIVSAALTLRAQTGEIPKDTVAPVKGKAWKENHYLDISMAGGENIFITSVQWDKLFGIAWKKRVKIGFGVRVNMANTWAKDFRTPFYNRPDQNTFDTLRMDQQTTFFVNLTFLAEISLFKWMDAGLCEDIVGVSFGERGEGSLYGESVPFGGIRQSTHPALFNAFLFGQNDRGSLNSQFYLRFWPTNDFFIKGGFGISHITQSTDADVSANGREFRAADYLGFISLGWTPGRNEWIGKKKPRPTLITPSF